MLRRFGLSMLVLVTGLLVTLMSWDVARDVSKRSEARRFALGGAPLRIPRRAYRQRPAPRQGTVLGGMDLASPARKMTVGVIATVAEFERNLLVERTQAGLARAKAEGKTVDRPIQLVGQAGRRDTSKGCHG